MIIYSKDRSYYEDLYDKSTVEWGLWHENYWLNEAKAENGKKLPEEMAKRFCDFELYFYTGERYENRETYINKWIERDRRKDDVFECAPIPEANCFICEESMELVYKDLRDGKRKNEYSVEFIFRCKDCKVSSTFGVRGREDRIPWQCPDCKRRLKIKNIRKGKKITTKEHCDFCGYNHEDTLDLDFKPTREKAPTKAEIKKFREDKLRFCLSDKEGMKYLESKRAMEQLKKICGGIDNNDRKPKAEELSVKQAQGDLKKVLKQNACENITFADPDTDRDVILKFKAIDSKSRCSYDARRDIKKAIRTKFKGTNWTLMSEGIGFKLGILTGRLRGKEDFGNSFKDIIY